MATSIAEYLKTERLKRGLTQEQMAQKLEVSLSHYKAVEQGKTSAGITLQFRIAKFTRRSPSFIYKLKKLEEERNNQ